MLYILTKVFILKHTSFICIDPFISMKEDDILTIVCSGEENIQKEQNIQKKQSSNIRKTKTR